MLKAVQALRLRVLLVAGLLAVTSNAAMATGLISQPSKTSGPQMAQIAEDFGKFPLSFEANTGQTDKKVKFLSRGSGYGLFLTGREVVLALDKSECAAPVAHHGQSVQTSLRQSYAACAHHTDVMRMRLAGVDVGAAIPVGEEQLPGTANYFIGNDPDKWHTSVPTYGKVRYSSVYPGIDLVYYGNQRQLEYDFVVAAGADPKHIRLEFSGTKRLRLGAAGDLVVTAADGALSFHKPVVYQLIDGQRKTVEGDFALLDKHTVCFRLGSYDHAKPLVIDPVLIYSTFLGGSVSYGGSQGMDIASGIAVDTLGYVYVTGSTSSSDFPITTGAYQTTNKAVSSDGGTNVFVTKLNPSGTALVYSSYLGGSGNKYLDLGDTASDLAVDSSGNVYVSGTTYSTDFPVTTGTFQTTKPENTATAFITKLNTTGTALVYSTYLGGSGGDSASGLALDGSGNAYVAGLTSDADFPVTAGAFQAQNNSVTNAFVTKLNSTGSALVFSTYLGGSKGDGASRLVLDSSGDVYVSGYTVSFDFPVTSDAYQTTKHAAEPYTTNAFVTKLNSTGTALIYSTYLGGSGLSSGAGECGEVGDEATGLAVDSSGNAYIAGVTCSANFPVTTGAFQTTDNALKNDQQFDGFVTKLNPTGTALVYSTYLGGSAENGNLGVADGNPSASWGTYRLTVDGSGNAYITGATRSTDFPVTTGAFQTTNNAYSGDDNAFVTILNPTGSALVYSTYLGGSTYDFGNALALDGSNNVYIAGLTWSSNFPVTEGAFQTTNKAAVNGGFNAFITKMDLSTTTATTTTLTPVPTPNPSIYGEPVTLTAAVTSTAAAPPNGENVAFLSGTTSLGTAQLSSGVASLTSTVLPVGTDSITAVYGGDLNFSGSTSTAVSQVVNKATASTTLTSSLNPSTLGASVTLTATVSGQFGGVATGSVTFSNGSTSLGTVSLSGNSAGLTTTALPLGTNAITAVYGGDLNFAGSTSNTVSQEVDESDSLGFTYSVYDFGNSPDGYMPMGAVADTQGNVYGITGYGGANSCYPGYAAPYGCGTIVKWDTTVKETVLHSFNGNDGAMPFGGIVLDGQGNFYGTTSAGGDLSLNSGQGFGTIFKLNLSTGTFTTIHSFTGTPDGSDMENSLVLDAQGNLYGSTNKGGANGHGELFKVDASGTYSVIYNFTAAQTSTSDHVNVAAVDAQGNFYGTLKYGGNGNGSVFEIDSPHNFTTLRSFTNGMDGSAPRFLTRTWNGNLYGKSDGSTSPIYFALTPQSDGTYQFGTVANFAGLGAGVWPDNSVIDAQGNQYNYSSTGGDTTCNAPSGCGTVYKIDTSNVQTVLHTFTGTNGDGTGPGGLMQDTQGNLLGATGGGNSSCSAPGGNGSLVTGCGTVFKLALPASIATTTTTLTSSQNPSLTGQSVTFTATVAASAGTAPNGETIAFMYGPIPLGTGTLSSGTASFTTTALPLGTDAITAVYAGDPNFAGSQSNAVSQAVNTTATTPAITWATPSAITYGTALSATQLNASSTVAGTFAYIPAAGTVLGAGSQTLSVTFTPTNTTDYTTATATVQLTVNQATPTITWATPAAITYGTALSATQLNASSTVAGTFAYTPAAGTVLGAGSQTLSVTFTPTDTTDYTTATATFQLTVNQATPMITWATPAAITYGTALSATQLDATASVPGSFVYSPLAGTTPPVGSDTLSVTFTPTDTTDYTTATATVTLTVNGAANPVPVIDSLSPAFTDAGGAAFILTVNGSGFISGSAVYWGTTALTTTYVSAAQLTASVTAAKIANAGTTVVTVQTPTPGGGTSNSWQFEVDSASGTSTAPAFTSTTATVTAGSTASYPVTLPSDVTSATVSCLNLPTGASCSYSSGTVTIITTSATPAGTYQVTVVFAETVSGAATAGILLPILLLPLLFLRRRLAVRSIWLTACLGVILLAAAALCNGCGGSSSSTTPQTHQVTSSAALTLKVQ